MKLLGPIAVLLGSISVGVAASDAAVFQLSDSAAKGRVPVLNGVDAVLNLADRFGVSGFYDLEELTDARSLEIGQNSVPSAQHPQLLLVVNGVENPDSLFENAKPLFEVSEEDNRLLDFLSQLPGDIARIQPELSLTRLSEEISLVSETTEDSLVHLWHQHFDKSLNREANKFLDDTWETLKDTFYLLSVQDSASTPEEKRNHKRSINLISDELFINEMAQLEYFFDKPNPARTTVINLNSLVSILKKAGKESRTYELATRIMGDLIMRHSSQSSPFETTVVVLPLSQQLTKISAPLRKRAEFSPISKRAEEQVFASSDSCYSTIELCKSSTSSCSGHGSCSQSGDCWSCVCSSTTTDSKTTNWSGAACQKIDYSVEFNLFLWTGVVLTFLFVSGVKLLASCGSEELPGVLVAATVVKKSNA
ncbi:unnamed protein product [Kuraishia capsulata CBS 1993]|uniref:Vacuolar sorting protein Vps3844 C-terminal domain-containing protein n=1 Tax=Kuraishia capsulata CBS 1993 TaxID=1382522 RepID=W6MFZ5_9ASCO|nr:uncharacterized protein KUCA_T00000304001 [Kuraishia capsulata CBS 1993]CDK24343.1 unnamed protein product [Kuraishia capsulata CBS 1993]